MLVVEILLAKSDVDEVLFYKAIKSEATMKVRLYDAERKQYILNEAVSGVSANKTYIPYTDVGKKHSVLAAVSKAADVIVQKVNQDKKEGNQ